MRDATRPLIRGGNEKCIAASTSNINYVVAVASGVVTRALVRIYLYVIKRKKKNSVCSVNIANKPIGEKGRGIIKKKKEKKICYLDYARRE